jgi:hypothetical protein
MPRIVPSWIRLLDKTKFLPTDTNRCDLCREVFSSCFLPLDTLLKLLYRSPVSLMPFLAFIVLRIFYVYPSHSCRLSCKVSNYHSRAQNWATRVTKTPYTSTRSLIIHTYGIPTCTIAPWMFSPSYGRMVIMSKENWPRAALKCIYNVQFTFMCNFSRIQSKWARCKMQGAFFSKLFYSALVHLPHKFQGVGGCWDWDKDSWFYDTILRRFILWRSAYILFGFVAVFP